LQTNPDICDANDPLAALRAHPDVKRILKSLKNAKLFLRLVFDATGADVKVAVDDALSNTAEYGCSDPDSDPGDDFSDDPTDQ